MYPWQPYQLYQPYQPYQAFYNPFTPSYFNRGIETQWDQRPAATPSVTQFMENQMAVTYEILSTVRQNNEMLRMLLSTEEQFFQHPAVQQS